MTYSGKSYKKQTQNKNEKMTMSNYIFFLSDIKLKTFPSLVKEEADKLEGLITLQEASFTLKIMQNGRSPGTVCLDFRF